MFRVFTKAVGIVTTLALTSGVAAADQWPSRTVRVIVPFSAGSAADIVPRIVFEQVAAQTKQAFVIENRPGGAFTIGVGAVKFCTCGRLYRFWPHSNGFVTTPATQAVNWDPTKDFSGVTTLADVPMVLVISPDKKVDTLQQLVAQAKANPGSLNYATAGLGAPTHLALERRRLAAGFSGQLVPFKGAGEALTEVATGRVDVYLQSAGGFHAADRKRQAEASGGQRHQARRSLAGCADHDRSRLQEFRLCFLCRHADVPKDTPRDVIDSMNAEVKKALAMPAIQEKLAKIGSEAVSMDPAALDKRTAEELAVTKSLVEAAKISVQ